MSFLESLKRESDDDSSKYMNTNNESVINELILKANFQNKNTFYDGLEKIILFKVKIDKNSNNTRNKYLCLVCWNDLDDDSILKHCSTYVHLFKYMQTKYPIELDRIISEYDNSQSIKVVSNFLNFIKSKKFQESKINEITNLFTEKEYQREIEERKLSEPRLKRLDILNYLKQKDDEIEDIEHKNLINSIQRSRSPDKSTFLQPFLADSQSSSDMDTNEATFSNPGPFNNDFNIVEPKFTPFSNNQVKRKLNTDDVVSSSSDIDTDTISNEQDENIRIKKIKKKVVKSLDKKKLSENFLLLITDNYEELDIDMRDKIEKFLEEEDEKDNKRID